MAPANKGTQIIVGSDDRAFKEAVAAVAKSFLTGNAAQMALSNGKQQPGSWSNLGGYSNQLLARVGQNLMSSFNKAPEELEAALAEQGLSWGPPFPPGRPMDPFWGYRRPPRTRDFSVGENVQLTPRWNRISFGTIKSLWEAYDVAQICTKHLINDIRSLDYHFEALPGIRDDVSDDIREVREFFDSPDKRQPFRSWLAEYLMDVIRYDAGTLYIRRNVGGDPIALEVVSGTTIIPIIDFYGRVATDEDDEDPNLTAAGTFHGEVTPGFLQIIMGLPWDWMAADDIIYLPINPMPESQYGIAPLESVLLTANTDMRFQWHFLNLFTAGSIPAGFMQAPPDMSDPVMIRQWQNEWDRLMLGDQEKLHQIRWVPFGAEFQASKPDADKFDANFPLYLMRRTCAAHGVTPNDLGFTETVNKATSEVQVDVQFRVGTLPYVRHVEDIIQLFITEHLHKRVRLRFDTGREIEDRIGIAQAEQIYINSGVLSPDEPRNRLGYSVDRNNPTPRFINNQRGGPSPLLALLSMAGKVDPETFGPAKGQDLMDHPLTPIPGILPVIGSQEHQNAVDASSALQANLIADTDGRPQPFPENKVLVPLKPPGEVESTPIKKPEPKPAATKDLFSADDPWKIIDHLLNKIVEKDEGMAPAAPDNTGGPGIRVGTGIQGVDLRHGVDDDEDDEDDAAAKEVDLAITMRRWRENSRNRVKKGLAPRRFADPDIPMDMGDAVWSKLAMAGTSEEVNAAFADVPLLRKAKAKPIEVAGIAVIARDSGRCLLLQRDNDDLVEQSGRWEWPAGHLETGETPWDGAKREWEEEVGQKLPPGKVVNNWVEGDYQGFVYLIAREDLVLLNPSRDELEVEDPDHPTQAHPEVAAWWYPKDAKHSEGAMRPEFDGWDWKLITDCLDKDERD